MTKKLEFLRFLSFRFYPIRKIESSYISGSFHLLQNSTVDVTQELNLTKTELRQKPKPLWYGLRRKKITFPGFPSFPFCPISKIENSEVLGSFLLRQILTVVVTQELKLTKINWDKSYKFMIWFWKKKKKIPEVSKFSILRFLLFYFSKFSFILNFDDSDWI